MALVTFTVLHNHHHYLFPAIFITADRNSVPVKQLLLILSFPPASGLLSFSMKLPVLDISCKWHHTISILLWLASPSAVFSGFFHVLAALRVSFHFTVQ